MGTIFITGASSGIGKATAKTFAENGWNVIATMRHPESEPDLNRFENVFLIRLDVRDRLSIEQAIESGLARFNTIDVLVNNAGFGVFGVFESIPRARVQEQFEVNVFGVMDVTRAVLPHFRKKQHGLIINVSSGAGVFTLPLASLYCASKFALEGFSEALAYELASQGIGIKLVIPHSGITGTKFSAKMLEDSQKDSIGLQDYDEYVDRTNKVYANMVAARSISAENVAETIYNSATDTSDQLRYFIGDDSRGFLKAKKELSDEGFVQFVRSKF